MERSLKSIVRLFIIMVIMIPMFVFADGYAPGISPDLKVKIVNENGWIVAEGGPDNPTIDYEEYQKINEKYIISKEEVYEKILKLGNYDKCFNSKNLKNEINEYEYNYYYYPYGEIVELNFTGNGDTVNGNELFYPCYERYDYLKDVVPVSDVYDKTEKSVQRFNKTQEEKVINKDGAQIYSGPSTIYNKVEVIPFNTNLKVDYYVNDWEYVTYNGKSGWVYNEDIATKTTEKIIIGETITMYNIENEKDQITLEKNTIVNTSYIGYKLYYFKDKYYGYSENYAFDASIDKLTGKSKERKIITISETPFYSEYHSYDTKIGTIPYGTILICQFDLGDNGYEDDCFVEYNGKKGWIYNNLFSNEDEWYGNYRDIEDENEDYQYYFVLESLTFKTEKAKIGDKVLIDIKLSNNDLKITSGTIYTYSDYSFKINYSEEDGYYILLDEYQYIEPKEYNVESLVLYIDNMKFEISSPARHKTNTLKIYDETEIVKEDNNENNSKELSVYQIVILCAICVAIIVISSIIMIIFVNKKKKNSNKKQIETNEDKTLKVQGDVANDTQNEKQNETKK